MNPHDSPIGYARTHEAQFSPADPQRSGPQSSGSRPIPRQADGSRPKRSRLNRPCDRCRKSKLACKISSAGPPCEHCSDSHRECTFDAAPPPRPAKRTISQTRSPESSNPTDMIGMGGGVGEEGNSLPILAGAAFSYGQDPSSNVAGPSTSPRNRARTMEVRQPAEITSFDAQSRFEPHVITTVLTTDLFAISSGSDDSGGHVCQISSDPKRPIYVVMQPRSDNNQLPVTGAVPLQHVRNFLCFQPGINEKYMLDLYKTHVHPALPILLPGQLHELHPILLSAILATSCSHSKVTRPLAAASAGLLAHTNPNGLAENNLAGVASAVLELNMRPNNNNRASYLLLARTVALAQLLGMHIDSSRWRIPDWEQELRIRLWWQLCIHDAWMSFLNSRPCHIQASNADVPLPRMGSVLEASCQHGTVSSDSARAFIDSCRLALLVRRLQNEVCVLQVTSPKHTKARRSTVDNLIREADQLAHDWNPVISSLSRSTGVTSFLLHLLGFRCMLRRIATEFDVGLGSTFRVTEAHLKPFKDCVHFIASFSNVELDSYFLIYAAHILGSVTSSLIRLTMADPEKLDDQSLQLLSTLLRALHRYQQDNSWDLAGPALRRAGSMATRLDDMQEHSRLSLALRGGSLEQSPLDLSTLLTIPAVDPMPGTDQQFIWDWTNWNMNEMNMFQ